jgi:type I restriction enzyme S subunit
MGELCYQITDGTHYTPTYVDVGIPFLSVKDVSSGYLDFSNTRFISEEEHQELIQRCHPEYGDILLTKVGTTGIALIVDTDNEFSIFVSVALLKFVQPELSAEYLVYLINSPLVKEKSAANTRGVGNKNLVLRDIKNFVVPIPPLEEQKRIVAKVDELFALCDQLAGQVTAAEASREQLLTAILAQAG